MKDRNTAITLAFTLGPLGAHRFYLGDLGGGFMYLFLSLLTCMLLPGFLSFVDGMSYAAMSPEDFEQRYGQGRSSLRADLTTRVTVRRVVIDADGTRREVVEERVTGAGGRTPRSAPGERRGEYGRRRPRNKAERERFALQVAAELGGVLTPAELSLATQMGLTEARAALDELQRHGACELEVDDEGLMRYVFPDLQAAPANSPSRMAATPTSTTDEDLHA